MCFQAQSARDNSEFYLKEWEISILISSLIVYFFLIKQSNLLEFTVGVQVLEKKRERERGKTKYPGKTENKYPSTYFLLLYIAANIHIWNWK